MSQPSIITKTRKGYKVTTRASDDPLSALFVTPSYTMTLWGARRLARQHQKYLAKGDESSDFREVVG